MLLPNVSINFIDGLIRLWRGGFRGKKTQNQEYAFSINLIKKLDRKKVAELRRANLFCCIHFLVRLTRKKCKNIYQAAGDEETSRVPGFPMVLLTA